MKFKSIQEKLILEDILNGCVRALFTSLFLETDNNTVWFMFISILAREGKLPSIDLTGMGNQTMAEKDLNNL